MPEPPPGFVREGSAPPATPATLAQAGPSLKPTPVEPAPPAAKLAAPVVVAPATDGQPVGPVVPVPQEQGLEEGKPPRWRQDLAEVGPALQENLIDPAKRVGQQAIAGLVMAPAMAATNLVKNAAGLAAKGAEAISQATGIPSGGAFHAIEQNMTRRMAVGGQQLEALGGEPQGVVENVVRATGELIGRAPEFAVAHSLGGLLGLAGLGALSKANQGAQAAAEEGMTYATLGAAAKGAPELFAKLESLANGIKESAWWRGMTIKERGLVVQSLDETIAMNPEMTEAAILRKWNNPTWRKQALERRAEGEAGAAQAEPAMAPASAQEPMPPRSQEPVSAPGAAISPEPMPMPTPAPESPPGANLAPRTAYPVPPLRAPQEVATLDKLRLEMAAKDALLEESGGLGLPGPSAPQSEPVPTPGGAASPQPGLAQPGPVSMGGDSSSPARPVGAPSLPIADPAIESAVQSQSQMPPPVGGGGEGASGFADRGGYADLPPEPQSGQKGISYTGEEFGAPDKVDSRTIRQRALDFVRRNLWGAKVSNPAIREPITISRPGIMKSLADPQKAFLLTRLPELLESGTYQGSAKPRKGEANIRQYHYLRQEIMVGGQTREVVLTIREANNGLFYYDNYLTKTVEGSPESQAASATSGLRSGPAVGEPSETNMAGGQAKVKPRGEQADHGGYAATPPPGGGGPAAGGPAGTSKVSPLEGPEMLELSQTILGQTPRVRRILRKKTALGVFYPGDGRIELAAKIFEKPSDALKTLAHEIGHAVDWLPDKDMRRGNLLGRVASLKKHIERFMAGKPGGPGPLTPADEARLRVEAERLLTKQPQVVEKEIDEEITRTLAITPDEVLAIFNDVTGQIKQTAPDLYRYVAGLGTAEKKSIVKAALKGQVRADLQQFAQTITEKTGRKIKTTTTIPGKAPLKKDIEKKFRELVQDEIRKRALLSEKVIREELKKLSQMWKPFNPGLDKRYTSYRHSGPELYADALSVLLNRPDLLQQHAPEFYRGFFAYLGEKPAVKAIYDEIQARLRDPERVMEARQAREEAGFAAAEASRRQALEAERKGVIKNWIVKSFVDTFGGVYGLSAKATGIRSGDTPLVRAHEKARLASAEVEAYYRKVYQEVMEPIQEVAPDLNKTGSIMLLQRVMGERGKVANPGAESIGTARRRLDYLRQQLGDEAYTTILERLEHFNELRQERVISVAEKAGIWSPELMAKAKGNNFYARFEVVDYMLQHQVLGPASGKIYSQWGTLKQVGNPLVATMLGDAGVINASRWAMATKELVKTLGRHFPDEIHPARRGTGGMFQEPRDRTGWGLVRYLDHGKPRAFEVTKTYADMYKRNPVMADAAVRLLNEFSSIPRSLYTGRNPLFWVFNLIKDFRDNLINLPGGPLEVWKLAPKYAEGLRHAYRAAADKPDALYDYLLRNHYLMPAYAAGSPGDDVALDTITRELTRRGIMKPSSSTTNPVLRPLAKVWDFLGAVGEAQSRTSKIAAHLYLKRHFPNLPEETQAYIVRNFAADPPYYRKGDWTPFVNSIWLFSNPAIQGYRRGVQAAFFSAEQAKAAGKSPWLSDFGLKFTLYGLMPKLFMWAVKYGLIGAGLVAMARNEEDKARAKQVADRLQKAMWGASKYNLVNYDIVPIPVPGKDGGVDFELLRIPKDHLSQFAGGIIWNFLDAASGDPRFKLPDALGYAADQAPDMNPVFSIPHNLWKIYIDRINPQDDFRGKSLIPEKAFEAGGLHLHGEVGRYIFNELSPVKLASGQQVEKADKDALDKAKEIPGLGPFVSKFMIDKEQGWRETYRAETEGARSAKAGRQLDINERITALVNEHSGQVPRSAVAQLRRDAIDQGLLDPKTVSVGEMVKRVQKVAARAGEDRRLEALQAAGSNEERAALLRRYRQEMDEGAYRDLVAAAKRQKAVTKDTMRKLRQAGGE